MFFLAYLVAELRHRFRQTATIAVGIAAGISLVVLTSALASGVATAQGEVLHALYGVGTDITVTVPTPKTGFNPITPSAHAQVIDSLQSMTSGPIESARINSVAGLPHVAEAAGGLILTESKSTFPGTDDPPPSSIEPPLLTSVVGVDPTHLDLGPYSVGRIVDGRAFTRNDTTSNVAIANTAYASSHNLNAGSGVDIGGVQFTVVGIVSLAQDSNPADLYIPLSRAQALSKLAGYVNTIYVRATSAADVNKVSDEISSEMPQATVSNSSSLADQVTGSLATASELASTLGSWLSVLALSAAFGAAGLLTSMAVTRRSREFGTLKAVGWPNRRIIAQVLGESLVVGVLGAVAGALLGIAGAHVAADFAPSVSASVQESNSSTPATDPGANGGFFSGTVGGQMTTWANPNVNHTVEIPFSAPVTPATLVFAVCCAIFGGVLSGLVGAWRVARLRPSTALSRLE